VVRGRAPARPSAPCSSSGQNRPLQMTRLFAAHDLLVDPLLVRMDHPHLAVVAAALAEAQVVDQTLRASRASRRLVILPV
jgi:hypothetical protein